MFASHRSPARTCFRGSLRGCSFVILALASLSILSQPAGATIRMSAQPIWQEPGNYPTGLGWADFDGNGWLDLAVTQGLDVTESPNYIFFNENGVLETSPGWTSSDRRTSNCVFIGDLDNDGDPDLATTTLGLVSQNLPPSPHVVYYNDGGVQPTPGWLSLPGNAFSCAGGDVDADGDIDLAFAEGHWLAGGLRQSRIFFNNGGVFDSIPGWESAELRYACDLVFGDLDRDGDLDLVVGWGDSTGVSAFYNHAGILEDIPSWSSAAISGGAQVALGDMDGDGFLDLAVADVPRGFFVFRNDAGVLEMTPSWSLLNQGQSSVVAWADIDSDGDLDLATASWSESAKIFESVEGVLSTTPSWSASCQGGQQIVFADFDEDSLITTRQASLASGKTLFYTTHSPIHGLLSVELNGVALSLQQYCYDPLAGWISLGVATSQEDSVAFTYVYSLDLDMALTDWNSTRVFRNEALHPPYVVPDLAAEPSTGHAPLSVRFTDLSESSPAAIGWAWDFDNDGSIDSHEQHPAWTFATPGTYDVALTVENGEISEKVVRESCVGVFDGESALQFDGMGSAVECAASPSLRLTDAVTLEAWICPSGWGEVQNSGAGRVADKSTVALYLNGTGNTYADHSLMLLLKNESGPPRVCCTPESSIVLGDWHHVAATYEAATGRVGMYINGFEQPVSLSSQPSGLIRENSDQALFIGNGSARNYTFDGIIDEVRVWNIARDASEIHAAMDGYLEGNEPGLIGYWRMNEGSGSIIGDWSPNGNMGNPTATLWVAGTPFVPSVSAEPRWDPVHDVMTCALWPPCPNPTAGLSLVRFSVPEERSVRIELYDINGHVVKTLTSRLWGPGYHAVAWDGTDAHGRIVAPGLYFAHMTAGSFSTSRPCILLR